MKFLYILVSNDSDIFYEQTLASVHSLKHYNPEAFVTLLVDDKTDKTLFGFRAEIKKFIQEYKVVPFDEKISNKERSRRLKTNMRNLLEGDFLYIDGDTAITDKLELSLDEDADIAAVSDLHARENDSYHVRHKKNNADKKTLGFTLSLKDLFFNGGVIYAKDSPKAHAFFDKWHELYLFCASRGIYTDQISLNETNHLLGRPIRELPGTWNCQVREAYNHLYRVKVIYPLLCQAKIVHFFGSGIDGKREPHPLMRKDFFESIKRNGKIDERSRQIICNAKMEFAFAPETLDAKMRFPLFFIYRQFPRMAELLLKEKKTHSLAVIYNPKFKASEFVIQGITLPDVEKIPLHFQNNRLNFALYGLFLHLHIFSLAFFFRYSRKTRKKLKSLCGDVFCWDCCSLQEYPVLNKGLHSARRKKVFFWNPLSRWHSFPHFIQKQVDFLKNQNFNFYTIEAKDAQAYSLELVKNVNRKCDEPENVSIRQDFYFIGKEKKRKETISLLERALQKRGFRTLFYLVKDKCDAISLDENVRHSQESACIVDIVDENQSAFTLRPFDALFLKRKLLTNSWQIEQADFYHPSNIYIIKNNSLAGVEDFMKEPYREIDPQIIAQYEVNQWLQNFPGVSLISTGR